MMILLATDFVVRASANDHVAVEDPFVQVGAWPWLWPRFAMIGWTLFRLFLGALGCRRSRRRML